MTRLGQLPSGGRLLSTMSREVVPLTLERLADLPSTCRACVRWELDFPAQRTIERNGTGEFEKELWLSEVIVDWGNCGYVAYVDGVAVGYIMLAPPRHFPRGLSFPTSPPSGDCVLLSTLYVASNHRKAGIARMLVQTAARDLTRRGVKAIEAFGYQSDDVPRETSRLLRRLPGRRLHDSSAADQLASMTLCMTPAGLFEAVGFHVVRPHHKFPRLRLDLRTALSWREDVEAALEKIISSVANPALASSASSPAGQPTSPCGLLSPKGDTADEEHGL